MTSSRVAVLMAVIVTAGLVYASRLTPSAATVAAGLAGNLAIPAIWAALAMSGQPRQVLLVGVLVAGVALMVMTGGRAATVGVSFATAGVVGGLALRARWRILPLLAVTAGVMVPAIVAELGGTGFVEATADLSAENRRVFEADLPAGLSGSERAAALANFDKMAAGVLAIQKRLWPSLVAIGLMTQAALALVLGWLMVKLRHRSPPRPQLRPWPEWRAPFFTVWVLIGGLAGTIPGGETVALVGWNVVVLAGLLLAMQGLAVMAWQVRRALPPVGRALFWFAGAFLLAPVLIGSGVLVGLADQWLNLRKPRANAAPDDDET